MTAVAEPGLPVAATPNQVVTRVDGHGHLYPRFDASRLLDSAWSNLVGHQPSPESICGALVLLDVAGVPPARGRLKSGVDKWRLKPTREDASALVERYDGASLTLIFGSQIQTSERVEVLAIGSVEPFPDGRSLDATLDSVDERAALPVIPWGFGKWWGRRGRLIEAALRARAGSGLCLGDNAGRPRRAPEHRLFRLAAELGVAVLPGSDPLDLPGRERRAGCAGFVLDGRLNGENPAAALMAALRLQARALPHFARWASWAQFMRDQGELRAPKSIGIGT